MRPLDRGKPDLVRRRWAARQRTTHFHRRATQALVCVEDMANHCGSVAVLRTGPRAYADFDRGRSRPVNREGLPLGRAGLRPAVSSAKLPPLASGLLKTPPTDPCGQVGSSLIKGCFFPVFRRFFVVFLRKILFLSFTMTSNAFSKTFKRFFKGSKHGVTQQLNQSTTQTRKETLCCCLVASAL